MCTRSSGVFSPLCPVRFCLPVCIALHDFRPGFARIVEANSQYYVLGYASSYKRQDRVYRELDVKVKRTALTLRPALIGSH